MRVNVYPRGKWLWMDYKYPDEDKPRQESLKIPNNREGKKLAEIKKQEKILEILRMQKRRSQGLITIQSWFDLFIEKKGKETKYVNNYENAYLAFKNYFGDGYFDSLTENDWLDFKNELKKNYAHNTAVTYLNHLRTIFDFIIKKDPRFRFSENPVPRLKKIKMPVISIPPEEYGMIIYSLKNSYYPWIYYWFIEFLYLTGFRRGEALKCRWENFQFHNKVIQIYNSKESRYDTFPIYKELEIFITKYKIEYKKHFGHSSSGILFPIEVRALDFFRRLIKRLKLPHYSIHDLRRTFGKETAKKVHPTELQKLMRHKDIRTTLEYYVDVDMTDIGDKLSSRERISDEVVMKLINDRKEELKKVV